MRRLLIWLPLVTGCYTYAPLDAASTVPGMKVRARLAAATAEQIETLLGVADARVVNGTVVAATPDTLIVEVPSVLRAEVGSSIQTLHQRLAIGREGIREIEIRRLDRYKTTIVVGAAAVLVGGFIIKATIIDPGKERLPDGGGGAELRPPARP